MLRLFLPVIGRYRLESADNPAGPFSVRTQLAITRGGIQDIALGKLPHPYYRLMRAVEAEEGLFKLSQ